MDTERESHRKQFTWLALGFTTSLILAGCAKAPTDPPDKMVPSASIGDAAETEQEPPEPQPEEDPIPEASENDSPDRNGHETLEPEEGATTTRYNYVWDDEVGDYVLSEEEPFVEDIENEIAAFSDRQQIPDDAVWFSAVTDEQKDLVDYVRGHTLSTGGKFDAYDEHLLLHLGFEGCMVAIAYGHEVDRSGFEHYIETSESIQFGLMTAVGDLALAEKNLVNLMTIGMNFMCPADHDAWRALYLEKYE